MSTSTNANASSAQQGSEDVARVQALLREVGIVEYDPRVVNQVMDIAYQTAIEMLQSARAVSQHCGKSTIDATDVRIASEFLGFSKSEGPSRELIRQLADHTNAQPLPQIRHNFGLKLPNDRFCLLQNNVQWRADNPVPEQGMDMQVRAEAPRQQLRPEQVHSLLKRKAATTDEFD